MKNDSGYDRWSVRAIIAILGFVVVTTTITGCALALKGKSTEAVAVFGVGTATVALLAPSPLSKARSSGESQDVNVVNPPSDPVPVEPS